MSDPYINTALLLIKGVFCGVLGQPIGKSTIGTHFSKNNTARFTIQLIENNNELSAPTIEQQTHIISLLNKYIQDDLPIYSFLLPRNECEEKYENAFYDNFNIPDNINELTLIYIPNIIINATPKQFLPSTSHIGQIEIKKVKYRANKKQLEVQFQITPSNDIYLNNDNIIFPLYNQNNQSLPSSEEILSLNTTNIRFPLPDNISNQSETKDDNKNNEQVVTPWTVESDDKIDYMKLVNKFGTSVITEDLISRIERLTNRRAHHWLRRGLFFSHRSLKELLDLYESGTKFYLYTGRGPSTDALHLGHLLPFLFTKYLQEAFNVPLVIQLTDDEKFLFKALNLEDTHALSYENAKDIIACGFDQSKTFIFNDLNYIQTMYPLILKINKTVTFNQARGIFGFNESDNIGMISFPGVQAAPSFPACFPIPLKNSTTMPCLIPCAIDQDPYFRMTRDVAPRLGFRKPSLMHCMFLPPLQGVGGKMSASVQKTSIYVTDTPKQIKKKINKYAFSGGGVTLEEQREHGANIEIDVAYQYLKIFLEDDEELEDIGQKYASGELLTGEVKAKLIEVLQNIIKQHQDLRQTVTDDVVAQFMSVRELDF